MNLLKRTLTNGSLGLVNVLNRGLEVRLEKGNLLESLLKCFRLFLALPDVLQPLAALSSSSGSRTAVLLLFLGGVGPVPGGAPKIPRVIW